MGRVVLEIDPNVGAAYIQLNDHEVARTVEVTMDVMVDLDELDVVVGVEILNLFAEIPIGQLIRDYHIHTDVVSMLQRIRPSVSGFVASFSSAPGSGAATMSPAFQAC